MLKILLRSDSKRIEKNEIKRLIDDNLEEAKCNCMHMRLVRLYTFGVKSDYGCLDCGMESESLSDFIILECNASGHVSL